MRRDGRLGFWEGLRATIAYLWTWARGGHHLIPLALVLTLGATGCAGTLHYPEYARAHREAYQARMQARAQMVEALARAMQTSTDAGSRTAAAMGLAMMLSRDPVLRMEAPRDQVGKVLGILAPIAGMWGIADTVGRHMSGHGGLSITAGDRSTIGTGSGNVTGPTESVVVSGDQAQGGLAGGDQTFTNSPKRDTDNPVTN